MPRVITAEYGYFVRIDFRDLFRIEPASNDGKCQYDYLEVGHMNGESRCRVQIPRPSLHAARGQKRRLQAAGHFAGHSSELQQEETVWPKCGTRANLMHFKAGVCLDQSACLLQFQRQAAKTAAVPKQAQQEEEGDSKMEIFVTLPPDQPCSAKEDNNHISNCVDRT